MLSHTADMSWVTAANKDTIHGLVYFMVFETLIDHFFRQAKKKTIIHEVLCHHASEFVGHTSCKMLLYEFEV